MKFVYVGLIFALWSSRTATLLVEDSTTRRELVRGIPISGPEASKPLKSSIHAGSDLKLRYQVDATVSRDDERLLRRASIFLNSTGDLGENSSALMVSYIDQFRAIVITLRGRADSITNGNIPSRLCPSFPMVQLIRVQQTNLYPTQPLLVNLCRTRRKSSSNP